MGNAEKLKELRDKYVEIGKTIAGHEANLKTLQKRKTDLLAKLSKLGIKPEELDSKLTMAQIEFDRVMKEIAYKLDPVNNEPPVASAMANATDALTKEVTRTCIDERPIVDTDDIKEAYRPVDEEEEDDLFTFDGEEEAL